MRIRLPENLAEEIYQLCLKTKTDWYYFDYYKKKRKTIDDDDALNIFIDIRDLGLDMSKELYQWFSSFIYIV